MLKRIKRNELAPGMFVVSHGLGTFESPLVHVGAHVCTQSQIAAMIPDGVEDVLIDTSSVMPLPDEAQPIGPAISIGLGEELHIARRLYAEALAHMRHFVDEVRKGSETDIGTAKKVVEGFIDSVDRNQAAAATLSQLRGFDEYIYTHSINVCILAVLMGRHLGLDRRTQRRLGLAGLYHDLGKIHIPEAILNKPGRLSPKEFLAVQSHVAESANILRRQKDTHPDIIRAVVEHHERHDGSGYPHGLKNDDISRLSRIVAVVDVYDALTSKRVYKEPMVPARALGLMYQWRGRQFAEEDIQAFIRCIGVFPVGSFVRLTSGECGIVSSANAKRPTKPQVRVVMDSRMRPQLPRTLDLHAVADTRQALDIAEVLDPAEHKIDLERFLYS